MNKTLKRVAAIHDISCLGKCSLTVALPIISATGVEVSVIPTAVLSTQTDGFENFTYRDLTSDMIPIANHWKSVGVEFDAFYTGFLGSFDQIKIVSEILDKLKNDNSKIIVDPVMGDNGTLYSVFDKNFAAEMKKLCSKSDIILPNITEACLMLNTEYKEGPFEKTYIEELLHRLSELGPSKIILTGVYFNDTDIGAASFDKVTGKTDYILGHRVDGFYPGTGDVFASIVIAGILNGLDISSAAHIAVDFTVESIERTRNAGTENRLGINFEAGLCTLYDRIQKLL